MRSGRLLLAVCGGVEGKLVAGEFQPGTNIVTMAGGRREGISASGGRVHLLPDLVDYEVMLAGIRYLDSGGRVRATET